MNATGDRSDQRSSIRNPNPRQLEVALLWGDTPLDIREFPDGARCSIGSDRGATFELHFPSAGSHFPFAAIDGEVARIQIPEGASIALERAGVPCEVAADALDLYPGDRLQMKLGNVSLRARWIEKAPRVAGVGGDIDFRYLRTTLLTLMGVASLVSALFMTDFRAQPLSEDLRKNAVGIVHWVPPLSTPPTRPLVIRPTPKPEPKPQDAHNVIGPRVLPGNKKQGDAIKVSGTVLVRLLQIEGGPGGGFTSRIFGGQGQGIDADTARALGNVHGDSGTVAEARGLSGMEARGMGPGGGAPGLNIGRIGTRAGSGPGGGPGQFSIGHGAKREVRVETDRTIVTGGCERTTIGNVIAKSATAVKWCYETELSRNPGLSGKVVANFTIDPTGSVDDASISHSTLGSPTAEACIARQVKRMKFPAPAGGGVCVINYPWIFRAAGTGEGD